jgi:hypothetical protein
VNALETERNRALEELARLRGGGPAPRRDRVQPTPSPEPPDGSVATQPDSIDVTLTEKNGVIKGSYRAKYRVPDSSVNPDASFEFSATLAGPILICPWTGPGGARGEVMVRQTSANSLHAKIH